MGVFCPKCNQEMEYIIQHDNFFCRNCQEYLEIPKRSAGSIAVKIVKIIAIFIVVIIILGAVGIGVLLYMNEVEKNKPSKSDILIETHSLTESGGTMYHNFTLYNTRSETATVTVTFSYSTVDPNTNEITKHEAFGIYVVPSGERDIEAEIHAIGVSPSTDTYVLFYSAGQVSNVEWS